MNDIEKTNIERKNSGKRMRRRKRMMSIYALVVFVLVATCAVTASLTFLFTVDKIVISGESETYTYMEIIDASGIMAGDNLIRLNTRAAEQNILDSLLYVESADIKKDYPSTLKVYVTRCIPAFNVPYDKGVLLVSRKGKILADNSYFNDDYPIIYGMEPEVHTPGEMVSTSNNNKNEAFKEIVSRFSKEDGTDEMCRSIANIDMNDEYNIVVNYRTGMVFQMGNWNDIEYKLNFAAAVMNEDTVRGKKGVLRMIGSKQCSFRYGGEADEILTPIQASADTAVTTTATSTETTTEAADSTTTTAAADDGYSSEWDSSYDDTQTGGWNNYQDDNSWNNNDTYSNEPYNDNNYIQQ